MARGGEEWKPFMAMVGVDLAFAVVNILLKKVLDEGMDHLVLVTYRLSISAIFLAPIAHFWERYSLHSCHFVPASLLPLSVFGMDHYSGCTS